MRPLVWKEIRVLRVWLIGGTALACALSLLVALHVFGVEFVRMWTTVLMPLVAASVVIGVAAGQVARERHNGTLEFLLARPVPPGRIVWAKFAAGSLVQAALVAGAVALCFAGPEFLKDTTLRMIREQVSLAQLTAALLPRFWFLYALALLISVLVDRPAKAAAMMAATLIILVALTQKFAELAPFSAFVYWLPFLDPTGGLMDAAASWRMIAWTGAVFACGAILVATLAARFLGRSSERYLGDLGLAIVAAAITAAAVGSSYVAANRLAVTAPVGSLTLSSPASGPAGIAASGNLAAVSLEHRLRIFDFTEPRSPRQVTDVEAAGWSSSSEWNVDRMAMQGDTVFLVGRRKMLPADRPEIAMVNAAGRVASIPLESVREGDYLSTPVPDGAFLYVGVTRDRVCNLVTFDVAGRREAGSLEIDRTRPPMEGLEEGSPPMRLLRRGRYLYISSPSWLTTVDLAEAGHPELQSRVPVRPKVSFLYAFPRPMAGQGDRLFEIRIFPPSLASYDLRDPAHPVAKSDLTFHDATMTLAGAGGRLYKPWRDGVMEFRASGDSLKASRYLLGEGGTVTAMAPSGDALYTLTAPDEKNRRRVEMYRIESRQR